MKGKLTNGMALVALALATGVLLTMWSQPEGDPAMEPPRLGGSRSHNRSGTTPAGLDAAAHSVSESLPRDRHGELSAGDDARLRELQKGGVALSDIPDALQFLQSLPDKPEIRELMVAMIRQWAESDGPSAARWAEGLSVGGARQECLKGVSLVWSNQDLDGTIQWAKRLPEGDEKNEVLRGVAYEAARTESLVAMKIAVELPASHENNALIQHATLQWTSESPEEAARWAGEIPEEALRDRVLSQVATVWGDSDPVAAATLAISKIAPGRAQEDAVIGIVQRWVQRDPEAVAAWVESFPNGALYETAAAIIAKPSSPQTNPDN
jgi:hypothetical protein